jgi:glycosyltransferase involved in cell wall biosynthesis
LDFGTYQALSRKALSAINVNPSRRAGQVTAPPTLLCSATFPANTGFAWDFIERSYARMADRLAQKGVRTLVAYPAIEESPKALAGSAAVPIVLDTELRTSTTRARMVDFVRKENVQVVYFTDRPLWSVWYPQLRRAGVRWIVVHDHTSGGRKTSTGIRRAAKRLLVNLPGLAANVIVGVSDFVIERDKAATLIAPDKFRRVWNGIDPVHVGSEDNRPDVRSLLRLSVDTPVVACACRATRDKGVDVLFAAFDRVWSNSQKGAILAYIGSGPQFNELAALRATLPSAGNIHMLGYLPEAAGMLRNATVCAVPSVWQEAFGLSVLEMMVRGRAVVASRVGAIPEIIEDGVSGVLVPPGDANALAAGLTTVLSSPQLRNDLGHAARQRAANVFTAERQISEMLRTFEHIFSR